METGGRSRVIQKLFILNDIPNNSLFNGPQYDMKTVLLCVPKLQLYVS